MLFSSLQNLGRINRVAFALGCQDLSEFLTSIFIKIQGFTATFTWIIQFNKSLFLKWCRPGTKKMCNANYAHKIVLYQIMLEHIDVSCIFTVSRRTCLVAAMRVKSVLEKSKNAECSDIRVWTYLRSCKISFVTLVDRATHTELLLTC